MSTSETLIRLLSFLHRSCSQYSLFRLTLYIMIDVVQPEGFCFAIKIEVKVSFDGNYFALKAFLVSMYYFAKILGTDQFQLLHGNATTGSFVTFTLVASVVGVGRLLLRLVIFGHGVLKGIIRRLEYMQET
ncbi:hypothetical protein MKW98_003181 [Papaver atlanticum]|uniref:Uncharacterized protein n=1 Tax=Papaver atlanticum TaxID=357466 RepID=A0AAD4TJG0_9MAGN|nr:hypothetical protein MKW98_003181 [Papaver atlanticum]